MSSSFYVPTEDYGGLAERGMKNSFLRGILTKFCGTALEIFRYLAVVLVS